MEEPAVDEEGDSLGHSQPALHPLGDELPIQETQLQQIGEQVLSFLVSRLVGNIGVFIALLVTASIVPQMLDSGAIDLREAVALTKQK